LLSKLSPVNKCHLHYLKSETEVSRTTGIKLHLKILVQLEVMDLWSVGRITEPLELSVWSVITTAGFVFLSILLSSRRQCNGLFWIRFFKVGLTEETMWLLRISVAYFRELHLWSGARGGAVVEALHYKPEGRGFDSRWCYWIFLLTLSFRSQLWPWGRLSL
jgi:hypothetical protein